MNMRLSSLTIFKLHKNSAQEDEITDCLILNFLLQLNYITVNRFRLLTAL